MLQNKTKIFRRNKLKDLLAFLLCSGFVVAGYLLRAHNPFMGWLGISFFGFGAGSFLFQLLTNVAYLRLNEEGFEEKGLFRTKQYKWSDVKSLRQVRFRGIDSIAFDYSDAYIKWKNGGKSSNFLTQKHGSITSSYTIKTEALLQLMKAYKRK